MASRSTSGVGVGEMVGVEVGVDVFVGADVFVGVDVFVAVGVLVGVRVFINPTARAASGNMDGEQLATKEQQHKQE